MKRIKQPEGAFQTDTFLGKPVWDTLLKGRTYAWNAVTGDAHLSVPMYAPFHAPEDSYLVEPSDFTRGGDGVVYLYPDTPSGTHPKARRWTFKNVYLVDVMKARKSESEERVETPTKGGTLWVPRVAVKKGEMFAGAGYSSLGMDGVPVICSVNLSYLNKQGERQFHDPVNAVNWWLTHPMDKPQEGVGPAVGDTSPIDDPTPEPKLTAVPIHAQVNSGYRWRKHPIKKKRTFHAGVDLAAPTGTPIYAAGDGIVTYSADHGGYGKHIDIDHGDGLTTHYAHLSKLLVKKDHSVNAGDLIGKVGSTGSSTGPHLHFEVRVHGRPKDPRYAIPAMATETPEETPEASASSAAERRATEASRVALSSRIKRVEGVGTVLTNMARKVATHNVKSLSSAYEEGGVEAAAAYALKMHHASTHPLEGQKAIREALAAERKAKRGQDGDGEGASADLIAMVTEQVGRFDGSPFRGGDTIGHAKSDASRKRRTEEARAQATPDKKSQDKAKTYGVIAYQQAMSDGLGAAAASAYFLEAYLAHQGSEKEQIKLCQKGMNKGLPLDDQLTVDGVAGKGTRLAMDDLIQDLPLEAEDDDEEVRRDVIESVLDAQEAEAEAKSEAERAAIESIRRQIMRGL